MKSNTKKIIFLTIGAMVLVASIVTPVVVLTQKDDEKDQDEKDLNKILEILEEKKDKIIALSNSLKGKIIANNEQEIIKKIKKLIGNENLKNVLIEISMKKDSNISKFAQKIIIKLIKNEISKEIEDFLIKRKPTTSEINQDILAIKTILDAKTGDDLIINLPSNSTGNIIKNATNKNAIEKQLRKLIDPSNDDGQANHQSLFGTTIEVSMIADAPISTNLQNIIVSISKNGGTTLRTKNIFRVKKIH